MKSILLIILSLFLTNCAAIQGPKLIPITMTKEIQPLPNFKDIKVEVPKFKDVNISTPKIEPIEFPAGIYLTEITGECYNKLPQKIEIKKIDGKCYIETDPEYALLQAFNENNMKIIAQISIDKDSLENTIPLYENLIKQLLYEWRVDIKAERVEKLFLKRKAELDKERLEIINIVLKNTRSKLKHSESKLALNSLIHKVTSIIQTLAIIAVSL